MKIKKENIVNAYENGDESVKNVLRTLFPNFDFGKELRASIPVTERIKTFEDAVDELGADHPFVRLWEAFADLPDNGFNENNADLCAYYKLRIIAAALNEGWQPKFVKGECRYYPWSYIYTKQEYEELDEDEKKKCRVVARSNFNAYAYGGVACAGAVYASSCSYAYYGSRLAFKTRDLAKYCGAQFIDIWTDFIWLIRHFE